VQYEFTSEGLTVNQDFYLAVLRHLQDAVQSKQPKIWTEGSWFLHHNNAPIHAESSVRQFLAKHWILTLPKPPYSPDLSPHNSFLFHKLKITLKGRRIQTVEDSINKVTWKHYHKHPSNIASRSGKSDEWWDRCVSVQWDCFDGDNI
jgi:transposase